MDGRLEIWKQGIRFNPRNLDEVALWVTLPNLDLQFWSEHMLSRITSKIGKPLYTDKMTANQSFWSYTRILVLEKANKPLRESLRLKGPIGEEFIQPIQYDWKTLVLSTLCKVWS